MMLRGQVPVQEALNHKTTTPLALEERDLTRQPQLFHDAEVRATSIQLVATTPAK